ncbi:MAG TPA: hypothetical protein VNZ52_00985, partial [Candidatus Thermoplasmatota archaeon]|nr:hypothetical protein [Candidatus Thermoplasmatota archaeon]
SSKVSPLELFQIATVRLPLQDAWARLTAGRTPTLAPMPGSALNITKGVWPEPDTEGTLEFRTPERTASRSAFVVRDHLPGARLRLQFTQGPLNGACLDVALHEANGLETVVVGRVGHLDVPKQVKSKKGRVHPTPRERRATAALASFLEATLLAPEALTETS